MLLDHGIAVLCHGPHSSHDTGICLLLLAYANLFLLKSECFKTKDKNHRLDFSPKIAPRGFQNFADRG